MLSHSVVSESAAPWTVTHQAPLSMGFSRQEYWKRLPFPPSEIFPTKGSNPGLPDCRQILYCSSSQNYGFSSSHIWLWELDCKKKLGAEELVLLKKTLEGLLDCKEIQPVHPKGNQSWIFIGRTDAETSIFWPLDAKSWLTGKDPDVGKYWRRKEKGTTEVEMVVWLHWLDGREFE